MKWLLVGLFLGLSSVVCAEDIPDKGICIVEYSKKDCGPCNKLALELDKIKDVKVIKIFEPQQGITVYPVLIFYKDGKAVTTETGFITEAQIREKLKEIK